MGRFGIVCLYITSLIFTQNLRHVKCQSPAPLTTYDGLMTMLTSGYRVHYFFNTTLCQSTSADIPQQKKPIFGGKIQYFEAFPPRKFDNGKIIWTQMLYVQEGWEGYNEIFNTDMKDISVYPDKPIKILLDRPTVNLNDTRGMRGATCQWDEGRPSDTINFSVSKSPEPKLVTSFDNLKTKLITGEEIRMITNTSGCNCTYNDCRNLTFGGDMKDFQVQDDGSVTFSLYKPIFLGVPFDHPMFYRDITFGYLFPNSTTKFVYTYLDPTGWFILNEINITCPFGTSQGHANFYTFTY
ncbi:uncharacterized protein LOC125646507 [Ostrea edulis]|uniref:uncharacterized protein LOC125646507 n=1 Tax=Ostrea edulis TaxID=37623 RepID=UPI0020959F10|nr:uncharacterized protein LOC125646507 [Ostrea edulis]